MTDTAAARPSATGETGQARLAEHLRAALSRVAQGGPPSARADRLYAINSAPARAPRL